MSNGYCLIYMRSKEINRLKYLHRLLSPVQIPKLSDLIIKIIKFNFEFQMIYFVY